MTAIATLGSHCALQVLKGAKAEGFKTVLVCEKKREKLYRRFGFIDEFILVDTFLDLLDQKCSAALEQPGTARRRPRRRAAVLSSPPASS